MSAAPGGASASARTSAAPTGAEAQAPTVPRSSTAADPSGPPTKSLLQRVRVPLGFLAAALYLGYLWQVPPASDRLAVGAAVAFVGVLVRAWAAGHIVKNGRLATGGPYAHTRNPLYVGSFLIACGFAVIATPWLLLVVAAFWALVYGPVMRREAEHVSALHPDAYGAWAQGVPAFVPRLTPWRGAVGDAAPPRFDARLYLYHREWQAGLGYVLALLWMVYLSYRVRR